jgi:two-component system chemotaxis response regulator CheB
MQGSASQEDPALLRVVAIGASAGGFSAVREILEALPGDFPAPILVVQHLDPRQPSHMAELIDRRCALDVREAQEHDAIIAGTVLIAPPDHHLIASTDGTVSVARTARVRFLRPAADVLFLSVAGSYRDRAIAVVLSGTGEDGAQGVRAIKERGGTVIVQDEASSQFSGMPRAAARTGCADHIVPLSDIAALLDRLVRLGAMA